MITADIQGLSGTSIVQLFVLDGTPAGTGVMRFHGYARAGSIWWQGIEYSPWPIVAEGFGFSGEQQPTPKLRVGNVDGAITTLCANFDDMVGSKITRLRTLGKYLDAVNFPGGNLDADANEMWPADIWHIERKTYEDSTMVEFELASAMDFSGVKLPRRQIIAGRCSWLVIGGYRGPYCGYAGPPVATADDTPTSNAALDKCGGRVTSCKLRFGETGELNYGGFPAAGMVRL